MKSDKELIRQRKYWEALGDNYVVYSYHIFLFKDNLCADGEGYEHLEIKKKYSSREEANRCVKLMTKRNKLPGNMDYRVWNSNADWL